MFTLHTNIIRKSGSALLVALWVLIAMSIMAIVFSDRVWRFSRSVDGIEQSNVAYYNALGQVEVTLNSGSVTKKQPWNVENSTGGILIRTGSRMMVSTGGTQIPLDGKGNSPFGSGWNIISLADPVQIVLPSGVAWDSVNFQFRVPNLDGDGTTDEVVSGNMLTGSGVILWTLSSNNASLFASGETNIFRAQDILSSKSPDSLQTIANKKGTTSEAGNAEMSFKDFYGPPQNKCSSDFKCTLKLSMIRPIIVTVASGDKQIGFLEYRITGIPAQTPSQFMTLTADGYANGFLRTREVRIPQITTSSALDFAILQ